MPDFLTDQYMFWIAEAAFVSLAFVSWLRECRSGPGIEVTRGEGSWNDFNLVYGVLAIVFLEIISTTDAAKGYKTAVTIVDLSLLLYLCFFNGWFRNKIVGIVGLSRNKVETHG